MHIKSNIQSPEGTIIGQELYKVSKNKCHGGYNSNEEDKEYDSSDSDNEDKYISKQKDDGNLHLELGKLNLSHVEDESGEGDSKADAEKIVAKGLIRDQRREKRSEVTRPYPQPTHVFLSNALQNGGDVVENPNYAFSDMVLNIPVPVTEHNSVAQSEPEPENIESYVFNNDEFLRIMDAVDGNVLESIDNVETSTTNIVQNDFLNEPCESESGYGTSPTNSLMHSPNSSVNSPNSLHSPNPWAVPKYDNRLPCYTECENDTKLGGYPLEPYRDEYTDVNLPVQQNMYNYQYMNGYNVADHSHLHVPQAPVNSISVDFTKLQPSAQVIPRAQNVPKHKSRPKQPQVESKPIATIQIGPERTKYLQPTTEVPIYEDQFVEPANNRLRRSFNDKKIGILWTVVACESKEVFSSIKDNKTELMRLLLLKEIPTDFLERIYVRLQRIIRTDLSLLKHRDNENRNALYIAATVHKSSPIIARLIADAYARFDCLPDETYGQGNSLLHILAGESDEFANVLAELLHATMRDKKPCFNVNSTNQNTSTPLHIAASTHSNTKSTYNISDLLIKHGANLTIQDKDGDTPLHIAIKTHCEPKYVKALLKSFSARKCINMFDSDNNTALHLATKRNDISFEKQKEVIKHLVSSNAQCNIPNRDGKLAIELVSIERKEEIKAILQKRM